MSAVQSRTPAPPPSSDTDLGPFRRRIRLLRAWRLGAMGGLMGAGVAAVMAALDLFSVVYCEAWMLAVPVAFGLLAGISRAVTEPLPDGIVARSIDRRGNLADRLTTASEVPSSGGLASAVHHDAFARAQDLKPAKLYPVKFGRWQGAFLGAVLLAALIYAVGNTDFFKTAQQKKDAASLKQTAKEVERIARPELEAAKKQDASAEDKALARELRKFTQDMNKGRMTKQEALVRANQLSQEAQRLQQSRASALAQSVQKAQTAAAMLQQRAEQAGLEKMSPSQMGTPQAQAQMQQRSEQLGAQAQSVQSQMQALQSKMDQMQRALDANKSLSGKSMSPAERAAMQKMLAKMQKQMAELEKLLAKIKLSQRALDFLQKLSQMPDFQAAQELLQKLAENAQAQQAGDPPTMTPQQMEEAAKELEQQAKELEKMAEENGSDEQIEDLARQMLEAAREARLGKGVGIGAGLMGAFGLGMGPHSNGPSGPGSRYDRWSGYTNKPPLSDKSSLLNVKFKDRVITSQIGMKGDQTYTEVTGPSTPSGRSSVPYQAILPKYEKSAESALNKSDIPPSERVKVRDYFNSLRK